MNITHEPFATTLSDADVILAAAFEATTDYAVYDLQAHHTTNFNDGYAVFLPQTTVRLSASDHDGALTLTLATWLETLPSVNHHRAYVAASIEYVDDNHVLINLSAFVYYVDADAAAVAAACWGTDYFSFESGALHCVAA